MPVREYKPEQIVTLLGQVEVDLANGKTTPQACKEAEIIARTYHRCYKTPGTSLSWSDSRAPWPAACRP
jgi:hypothetical protein